MWHPAATPASLANNMAVASDRSVERCVRLSTAKSGGQGR
jgi:hypothetical protein